MFVTGIACIAAAAVGGEAQARLVLVFPVFSGSSWLFVLGVLLTALSFIAGFAMIALGGSEVDRLGLANDGHRPQATGKSETSYGGLVLVGPIPIVFGSNRKMAMIMLMIGIALAVVVLGVLLAS